MRSVRDYVIPVVDSIIYFIYIYISLVVGSYDSGTGGGGRRCCMYSWCGCGVVWCGLSLTTRGDGSGRGTVEWTMNEATSIFLSIQEYFVTGYDTLPLTIIVQ